MFNHSVRKPTQQAAIEKLNVSAYPHRLSFYQTPPTDDVTLEEFETWAVDRLRVLAEIEAASIRDMNWDAQKNVVHIQTEKYLPLHQGGIHSDVIDAERRKDHVSHFILRLAFCRSEELRAKFVKAETTLFRVRYADEGPKERQAFLSSHRFGGERVSDGDKQVLKDQLMAATPFLKTDADFDAEPFFRVVWTKVTDLVSTRRVFIRGGYAYVPSTLQSSIINQEFSARLTTALEATSRAIPTLDEDDRLIPILSHFSSGFLAGVSGEMSSGAFDVGEDGGVTKDMVDDMARRHFPACMRNLHSRLRGDRHLKHQGRLQYTLFLKVLGLPIEEAIAFWREAFGDSMTSDKFNKEYRYNIRHSYGLEGKRSNYPARNCSNIITQNRPGPGEAHGCPFRDFSTDKLRTTLNDFYDVPFKSSTMETVLNAVESSHYHVACTEVFRATHGGMGLEDDDSVSHPNQYAARSRVLAKEAEDKARAEGGHAGGPKVEVAIEDSGEAMVLD